MASVGEENGSTEGLNLIPGIARKHDSGGLRIPHVGWNTVTLAVNHPIFKDIKPDRDFYFAIVLCFSQQTRTLAYVKQPMVQYSPQLLVIKILLVFSFILRKAKEMA